MTFSQAKPMPRLDPSSRFAITYPCNQPINHEATSSVAVALNNNNNTVTVVW